MNECGRKSVCRLPGEISSVKSAVGPSNWAEAVEIPWPESWKLFVEEFVVACITAQPAIDEGATPTLPKVGISHDTGGGSGAAN